MAQSSSNTPTGLYPLLESSVAPLDESEKYLELIKAEKEFIQVLKNVVTKEDPLEGVGDTSILPIELISSAKVLPKMKLDPLKRLKELSSEEVEEEEEQEDEEDEDEEIVEDEENAGGDYVVSHFDNGEGYEDNDDEGDEMGSTL